MTGSRRHDILGKKENNLSVHFTATLPADPTQAFKAVIDVKKRLSLKKSL
jgi:hypothetical protein